MEINSYDHSKVNTNLDLRCLWILLILLKENEKVSGGKGRVNVRSSLDKRHHNKYSDGEKFSDFTKHQD